MQLGLENKKQTQWAVALGVIAILAVAYELIPMFSGSTPAPVTSTQSAVPIGSRAPARNGAKNKKARPENLDPTLRLDLLASAEQTQYEGSGRNIFVSQAEAPAIPTPGSSGATDAPTVVKYTPPPPPQAPPIPLKFFGFASKQGEAKKIFLSQGEDVFVAGEGEIVNRRYKIIQISPTSVEMQDMVYSGPTQHIPLTQG